MNTSFFKILIFVFVLVQGGTLYGQDYLDDDDFESQYEKPLTIDLNAIDEEDIVDLKKKKVKRNVYYDKKTRRSFTKKGFGGSTVLEEFSVLKVYEDPLPYVRDIYWFDFRKRKIIKSRKINKDNAGILHGPYTKKIGDQIVEQGIFYMGTKHGRWTKWNKHNILQTKEKYYKGWPKESLVAYHNKEEKKLKEIIPIHFGEKEGNYYAFHQSGNLAARGEYRFDHKVGTWREYYDQLNRRKREISYPKDPFDDKFVPFIAREWDKQGKLIYERKKK